ncbi:MAG TPA: SUF system NifU family Fe-S cluster assembly protein [Candidatus Polarisedimenticolia bacterium]|nr:SUF system NifU family Fe-S cluster assembly protein [Candidatus Polarisedimenticolia bacterium]
MSDLSDLYQEVILDHNKSPRNFREITGMAHRAIGHNPLCGDKVTVYVKLDGDIVREVSFTGSGCAISKASASMMTEALAGKTRLEVDNMFTLFHDLVTGKPLGDDAADELGKLVVFSGVREFPVRVKCASLAWHTMRAALDDMQETTSTE